MMMIGGDGDDDGDDDGGGGCDGGWFVASHCQKSMLHPPLHYSTDFLLIRLARQEKLTKTPRSVYVLYTSKVQGRIDKCRVVIAARDEKREKRPCLTIDWSCVL